MQYKVLRASKSLIIYDTYQSAKNVWKSVRKYNIYRKVTRYKTQDTRLRIRKNENMNKFNFKGFLPRLVFHKNSKFRPIGRVDVSLRRKIRTKRTKLLFLQSFHNPRVSDTSRKLLQKFFQIFAKSCQIDWKIIVLWS